VLVVAFSVHTSTSLGNARDEVENLE
jgi:hypothetical protein